MKLQSLARPVPSAGPKKVLAIAGFVVAAALLVASSYVHFHLWQDGYRHIPTIGDLFLLQAIAGVVVAIMVIGVRRVWSAIVGAGFALSTLVGFLISVNYGLFGFKDSSSAPYAHMAFALELAAVIVCVFAGALCASQA